MVTKTVARSKGKLMRGSSKGYLGTIPPLVPVNQWLSSKELGAKYRLAIMAKRDSAALKNGVAKMKP